MERRSFLRSLFAAPLAATLPIKAAEKPLAVTRPLIQRPVETRQYQTRSTSCTTVGALNNATYTLYWTDK